jgi:uncharacterized membrane protein YbhN (UPF0104 family)
VTTARSAWVRLGAGLAVGGLLLWLALREVAWADFAAVLGRARWGWLALSWLAILAAPAVKGWRWWALLPGGTGRPGWLRLTAILAVGQLANVVIPARAGELTRSYLVGRDRPGGMGLVLGTILVEKALDGVALLGIAGGLALTVALPGWFGTAALAFAGSLALIVGLVVALSVARGPLGAWSRRLPPRVGGLVSAGLEGVAALRGRGVLAPAALSTAAVWLLGLACNYSLFLALGVPATVAAALLLLVVHYLAVLIPGVPAQVGLFHYVTVLAMEVFAVGPERAMPYAVVLHGLIYGTIIAAGALAAPALSLDLRALGAAAGEGRGAP